MISPYREPTEKYPWLSIRKIGNHAVNFMMANPRSDSWYGGDINQNNSDYLNLIKRGDRVIDCGANEGFLSVLAALRAGESGSVLALEPAPHNWEPLNINIALNQLQKRVHPQPWAVGDVSGKIDFSGERVHDGAQVNCVRLDEFCWFGPDVIKIDVEGYELKVLRGAREMLIRHKPVVFLELHLSGDGGVDMRKYGDTPEQLWDVAGECGYTVRSVDGTILSPSQSPNGVVILRPIQPKPKRSTMVYTLAHGPEFFRQAKLMVQSLREFGEYDGDLVVITDQPGKVDGAITIQRDRVEPVPHMEKAHWGRFPIEGFDRVLFLDSDLVILRPILPILEYDCRLAMPIEHPSVSGEDRWFGKNPIGYNSGTILADAAMWPGMCDMWLRRMRDDKAWELSGHDQPCINNLIFEQALLVKPFPREWFYFFSPDSEPITKETIIAHTKGLHRFEVMEALYDLRKLA
jgi:FkbM family methyltransferase